MDREVVEVNKGICRKDESGCGQVGDEQVERCLNSRTTLKVYRNMAGMSEVAIYSIGH